MGIEEYFSNLNASIEFLIALGSLIGVLGLIVGFIIVLTTSRYQKRTGIQIIIISLILIAICGFSTGLRYFRIGY
ncbi:MAG: hypothetical protein ACFFD2_20095 [Promethearchaeota archaeon]